MSAMPIKQVLVRAAQLVTDNGSAQECLRQAQAAIKRGDTEAARRWARKCIAYSVGVFHPAYREVAE